jgi:hypothetical protein
VGRNSEWLVKGHDHAADYFKFTVS